MGSGLVVHKFAAVIGKRSENARTMEGRRRRECKGRQSATRASHATRERHGQTGRERC